MKYNRDYRQVEWSIKSIFGDLHSVKRAGYNKVFYDPTSHVENDWRFPDSK